MSTLGILLPEELPGIASAALAEGVDSKSLRILAGLTIAQHSEGNELFERALKELKYPRFSRTDALRIYIRVISGRIIDKELSPIQGAQEIWQTVIKADASGFHEGDPFIYALSELQERPQDRAFFLNEIVAEARRWIERGCANYRTSASE